MFVRGRGFDHLADPAARLTIAGVTPLSVQRVSATSLAVSLPALSTGQRALTISSTLGGTSQPVQLRVMNAAPRLATSMVTGGSTYGQDGVTGIVHDPRRGDIYLANSGCLPSSGSGRVPVAGRFEDPRPTHRPRHRP